MNIPLLLAKVLGALLTIECIALLYRKDDVMKIMKMSDDILKVLMFFGGLFALFVGLSIVVLHNVWTPDWQGLITFIGWLVITKGLVRLFLPEQALRWGKAFAKSGLYIPVLVLFLIIGAYLAYVGFGL